MALELLEVGKKAPAFTLKDQNGETVKLSQFNGQKVVLYFYPRAMTPGCTVQACAITESNKDFKKLNTVVLGVSTDEVAKLKRFEEKKDLNFTLLSDPENKIADKYKVWGLKKFMGKEYIGMHRVTYIIDEKGKIVHVMAKVKTKTHHDDVIEILNNL